MEILCANQDFVVCVKPVGLDSEQQVPELLQELLGGTVYTLHRLDKRICGNGAWHAATGG